MTVEELVGILRDQGFLRFTPGEPWATTEQALKCLEGAYEIGRDFEVVAP